MNYIIFDLEWNQSLEDDDSYDSRLPFEIIEIGAVKLDENLKVKGMFSQIIKPQLYKKLYYITKELLDITEKELEKGQDFQDVYADFIEFCGEDCVLCTWGDSDIYELLNNAKYYECPSPFDKPVLFYDIQRLYARQYNLGKSRLKLKNVVELLGIKKVEDFHRAINDAKYTAAVMQHLDMTRWRGELSVDTFFIPKNRNEEVFIKGEDYTRFVSKPFADRNDMMEDKVVASIRCPICGRNSKQMIAWFLSNSKNYYCLGKCVNHGYIAGKIKSKQHGDQVFAIKKVKLASEEDAKQIQNKKAIRQEQQRKKRHQAAKKNRKR